MSPLLFMSPPLWIPYCESYELTRRSDITLDCHLWRPLNELVSSWWVLCYKVQTLIQRSYSNRKIWRPLVKWNSKLWFGLFPYYEPSNWVGDHIQALSYLEICLWMNKWWSRWLPYYLRILKRNRKSYQILDCHVWELLGDFTIYDPENSPITNPKTYSEIIFKLMQMNFEICELMDTFID